MLTLSKFTYKGKIPKIKLHHPFRKGTMPKLRTIDGFTYSATHDCWYMPYTKKAFVQLKNIIPNFQIIGNDNTLRTVKSNLPKKAQTHLTAINKHEKATNATMQQSKTTISPQLYAAITIDKEKQQFKVKHSYSKQLWYELLNVKDGIYQKEMRQWIFKGDNATYKTVKSMLTKYKCKIILKQKKTILEQENNPTVRTFIEALIIKNYSQNTIDAYVPYFRDFVNRFATYDINKLNYNQLRSYILHKVETHEYGETTSKHLISAIKFYYERILGWNKMYFNLHRTKRTTEKNTIAYSSIKPIVETVRNNSHQLILLLHYTCGLKHETISQLTLNQFKQLLYNTTNSDYELYQTLQENATDHYNELQPKKYLFENTDKKAFTPPEIKQYTDKIVAKYQLNEIYKLNYSTVLKNTGIGKRTTDNYVSGFLSFLKHFNFKSPAQISNTDIKNYILHCKTDIKLSSSYINNQINTIKLYYRLIENRKIDHRYIMRPKREKKLPVVLSISEVTRMITATKNLKHKNMLAILYASGLRRSELLNLKLVDIDFERNVLTVRSGKGKKDRQTPLAQNMKEIFEQYILEYKPREFIFEGQFGGKYSGRSLEEVVRQSAKRAGVVKHVTPHTLRHSFATHLLEDAVDIRFIQELLGHNNIKTTERYTHVANTVQVQIKSPLDKLNMKTDIEKPP